jgi:hypothetical protein
MEMEIEENILQSIPVQLNWIIVDIGVQFDTIALIDTNGIKNGRAEDEKNHKYSLFVCTSLIGFHNGAIWRY